LGTAAVISLVVLHREPELDAFPPPPTPAIAPDGTRTFLIQPGTEVGFLQVRSQLVDAIVCKGEGRASVPPPGTRDIDMGAIRIDAASNGDVTASCEPHPLAEM
jgi:hypothetical protein